MNKAMGVWLGGQGHLAELSAIPSDGGTETGLSLRKDTNPAGSEAFKQLHVLLHEG